MGGVLRIPQVVQREVGRDDQRLTAAVTAVYHIENLFQPVLGAALHAEVVKDQQRIAARCLPPACTGRIRRVKSPFPASPAP